jgi:hypothetical protein
MIERFGYHAHSQVIEIASNDGYLLQYFKERDIPVLGIEPAENVAKAAQERGIATLVKFFGVNTASELAAQGVKADLLLGNNVLAHVPNIEDFVGGMRISLKPRGVITMEFPHLLNLIRGNQFDTIYHEHFSYLSLLTTERIFAKHGLTVFDVDEIPTHGGSLRIYARHADDQSKAVGSAVHALRARETEFGLGRLATYAAFSEGVKETKRKLLGFLIAAKRDGKQIVGYGAPAKGNTLLNYCGVRTDFLDYTVDRNPHKRGCLLPGTRIPICDPARVRDTKPDYLFILPWNLRDEIMQQMAYIRDWGGKFVVPIPEPRVLA